MDGRGAKKLRAGRGQRGQKRVPWRGTFRKFDFHGVEKPGNLGSMAWKNGEFDFHGVELFAERRLPLRGGGKGRRELRKKKMGQKRFDKRGREG